MTSIKSHFDFASLSTSDYVDDSRQQFQRLFLIMLASAPDDEYITLAYNSHTLSHLIKENEDIKEKISFSRFETLDTFYIFHKNQDDILFNFESNNQHPYRQSDLPIFVQVTEQNLLQIEHNISSTINKANPSFFCFLVKDLKNIFSHLDKDISEFLQIYLEKMKIEPIKTLDNKIIKFPKNLWDKVELNRDNINEVSNLLFPTDSSHQDIGINLFFTRWHNPIHFATFVPLSSWAPIEDYKNHRIHSDLAFISENQDVLQYQNKTYLQAIKQYPIELYQCLKSNSPIDKESNTSHFHHLKFFDVNLMDYLPYLSRNSEEDIKIFMEINNIFSQAINEPDIVINDLCLRVSHIQNLNGRGTESIHSAFNIIYLENPHQVIPILKKMSYVHDAYFIKPIILELFEYLSELGKNNPQFLAELEKTKINHFPFCYEVFNKYPALTLYTNTQHLEINMRSLLSQIEDNRYQHIVDYTKFYFKHILSALGENDESRIKEQNIDKFIFHSYISDVDKISIDFSAIEVLAQFSEEEIRDILKKLSQEFIAFIQKQQDVSSHEPKSLSPDLREKILKFTLELKKSDNSTHTKRKI